jgi:hypothetical protein
MSHKQIVSFLLIAVFCLSFCAGCSSISKSSPVTGSIIDIGAMKRGDYEVLEKVTGESESTSILCGLIQINDGNLRLFYISFYTDKISIYSAFQGGYLMSSNPINRAYYNALAKTPDADTVLQKSINFETSGIPCIYSTEKVRIDGKAVKIKTDKEIK